MIERPNEHYLTTVRTNLIRTSRPSVGYKFQLGFFLTRAQTQSIFWQKSYFPQKVLFGAQCPSFWNTGPETARTWRSAASAWKYWTHVSTSIFWRYNEFLFDIMLGTFFMNRIVLGIFLFLRKITLNHTWPVHITPLGHDSRKVTSAAFANDIEIQADSTNHKKIWVQPETEKLSTSQSSVLVVSAATGCQILKSKPLKAGKEYVTAASGIVNTFHLERFMTLESTSKIARLFNEESLWLHIAQNYRRRGCGQPSHPRW